MFSNKGDDVINVLLVPMIMLSLACQGDLETKASDERNSGQSSDDSVDSVPNQVDSGNNQGNSGEPAEEPAEH